MALWCGPGNAKRRQEPPWHSTISRLNSRFSSTRYLRISEKLNEYKALGLPLPDDFVRVEKELEAYFAETERAAKPKA